ncbi:hypothetical protein RIR_jg4057.t1 [Rhizophagus irregularis DAOM 181602=DAOM 197198]|nr:hypothetical protein RIR_jg4057.t1 [Rhizophagus irregularis DAOM 181602=DAOM 197198]
MRLTRRRSESLKRLLERNNPFKKFKNSNCSNILKIIIFHNIDLYNLKLNYLSLESIHILNYESLESIYISYLIN